MNGTALTLWDIPILAAAAFALSRLWFQGSIFAGWLEKAKLRADDPRWYVRNPNELLSCPLCFATQTTIWLSILFVLPRPFLPVEAAEVCRLVLYTLAAMSLIPIDLIEPADDDEEDDGSEGRDEV